ncbi:MAG: ATP-binding cassette domain-containing protein [Fimbriimonadales bacterium]|nr:ATP-binding cassette domain-containing protein [Fimbriimonadales bacterium]
MPAIVVEHLSKTYYTYKRPPGLWNAVKSLFRRERHEVHAVRDISFTIEEGELVGFLGPNGAGKTTTLKMLSGIIYPSAGTARVLGYIPWERRPEMQRQIALVMGQKMQLWWDLPPYESYILLKALYEVPDSEFERRVQELAEMLEIRHVLHTQVRRLSLGERMKCELLAALLHRPRVLFLDEPTIGLDVVSQKRIREFLKEYNRRERTTILLTSHYMQDVQELAQRVLIIHHGQLIFDDTLRALVERFSPSKALHLRFERPVPVAELSRFGRVVRAEGLEAVLEAPREQVSRIASEALHALPIYDITIEEVDVDEIIRDIFAGKQKDYTDS